MKSIVNHFYFHHLILFWAMKKKYSLFYTVTVTLFFFQNFEKKNAIKGSFESPPSVNPCENISFLLFKFAN